MIQNLEIDRLHGVLRRHDCSTECSHLNQKACREKSMFKFRETSAIKWKSFQDSSWFYEQLQYSCRRLTRLTTVVCKAQTWVQYWMQWRIQDKLYLCLVLGMAWNWTSFNFSMSKLAVRSIAASFHRSPRMAELSLQMYNVRIINRTRSDFL